MTRNMHQQSAKEFMKQYMQIEHKLYGYIMSCMPNWNDADDIIQTTAAVMWEKYDVFQPGSNFWAWAVKIAHFQILAFRQKKKANLRHFDDETLIAIQKSLSSEIKTVDLRRHALRQCLGKLDHDERQLLQQRYEFEGSVRKFAGSINYNVNTLYKFLNRIHRRLYHCVLRTVARQEGFGNGE